jgi:hypothetical protein
MNRRFDELETWTVNESPAIASCTDCYLYRLLLVPLATCTDCYLYRLLLVPITACTDYYLYRLLLVPIATCTACCLYRLLLVPIATCTACYLYHLLKHSRTLHFVHTTCLYVHILFTTGLNSDYFRQPYLTDWSSTWWPSACLLQRTNWLFI